MLEEHARLVMDDKAATEHIKTLRHGLAEVSTALGPQRLLAARDIQHDVGTEVTIATERTRASTRDVAAAAAKRTTESLRTIEEYGKLLDPTSASRVERLRYEVYAIEQDLLVGGPVRQRFAGVRLHVLVTESLCNGPWLAVCKEAIAGGADVLQLREKGLNDRELLARAKKLRALTTEQGVLLFINDRADIARLVGADGVHVGRDDLSVVQARRIAGPSVLVGTSTHSIEEAETALGEEPDYIAVGPMFASATKPEIDVRGPALLAKVRAMTQRPIVAIGGIAGATVAELATISNIQVAVCQAVIGARDVTTATRALKEALVSGE